MAAKEKTKLDLTVDNAGNDHRSDEVNRSGDAFRQDHLWKVKNANTPAIVLFQCRDY